MPETSPGGHRHAAHPTPTLMLVYCCIAGIIRRVNGEVARPWPATDPARDNDNCCVSATMRCGRSSPVFAATVGRPARRIEPYSPWPLQPWAGDSEGGSTTG